MVQLTRSQMARHTATAEAAAAGTDDTGTGGESINEGGGENNDGNENKNGSSGVSAPNTIPSTVMVMACVVALSALNFIAI